LCVGSVFGGKPAPSKRGAVGYAAVGPQVAYAQPAYAAYAQPAYAQQAYAVQPAVYKSYAQPSFVYAQQQPAVLKGVGYAAAPVGVAYAQPAILKGGYAAAAVPLSAGYAVGPKNYQQSIPAAAIRNVEIVGITKTITPVVTKTITRQTHAEPALSIGHVQGRPQTSSKLCPI
jgi:hypothetical protein